MKDPAKKVETSLKQEAIKALFVFIILHLIYIFSPQGAIDPWGLFNPKKVLKLVIALATMQFIGSLFIRLLGAKVSAIISGLMGGFISSTATTLAVARKSNEISKERLRVEGLVLLSALVGMIIEAIVITAIGIDYFHYELLIIFIGPIATAVFFIVMDSKSEVEITDEDLSDGLIKIYSLLSLSLFIIFILAISKLLQNIFGQSGLYVFTFLVSLLEIHSSIIASIQLHETQVIDLQTLMTLLSLSLSASYISKLFIIRTLGNDQLNKKAKLWIFMSLLSLAFSWIVGRFLI